MRKGLIAAAIGAASLFAQQQTLHLNLAEAERLAVQNNPRLSAAKFNAAAAHQTPLEYKAAYAPTFFGSITGVGADNGSRIAAGGLNNPVLYNRLGTGLTVGQMITDFGRTGNLVSAAKLHAAAQDQLTETARAQILLSCGTAYFGVLRGQALLKVAIQTVDARQLVVDQVSALADAKLKSTLDVSFAKVNLSDAKLLLAQAQNNLQAAEADLASAMGIPGQTSFTIDEEPMPSPLPDRVQELIGQALNDRPELKDLRLEESSAQRQARAEHSSFFPSVSVVGTAGFAPAAVDSVPGKYGAIGLNVSIPLFNGGLTRARQTEAELKSKAVNQNVADLENRITRDVRVAWLNATTAYDRMSLTQELLDQAELSRELAQTRYDNGLSNMIELSTAQLNLTSAQIANSNAKYEYQLQRVVVDYQVGGLR